QVDFGDDAGGFSDFFRTIFGGGFGNVRDGGFGGGFRTGGGGGFEEMFGRAAREPVGHGLEAPADLTLDEVPQGAARSVRAGGGGGGGGRAGGGVGEGSRVRAGGEGGGAADGPRGDLYLRIHTLPHAFLERKGDDLQTTVTVPLTTAVLGGEVQVPTLEGPVG